MGWKIPFRAVYTDSFRSWLKLTFWCHVVIRVFPHVHDFERDALLDLYVEQPETLFEQMECHIREAQSQRALAA